MGPSKQSLNSQMVTLVIWDINVGGYNGADS